ncbi:MAG TPA: hypothetical protein VL961_07685, partial [Acidimicrobiales bacterium]|nr:hypothetical protein [Acidimicrobiales bacterium]
MHMLVQTASAADATGTDATNPSRTLPSAPVPHRIPPAAIALFGLALGITVLVAATLARRVTNDVFWQLAAGQWMLSHHAVMGLDPFSYTESGHRWIADEWGSEVILAAFSRAFGVEAYNILSVLTGSLCLVATTAYARALGARGGRLAFIAFALSFGIAGFVTQDRGLSFSLIWLPVELLVLARARSRPAWLWALLPLCVLWVNTHGSILVGLGVVAIELAWSLAPRAWSERLGAGAPSRHSGALGLATVGCVAASCLTPYGAHLLTYDLSVATNSQIGQYIEEWQSPNFHSLTILAFVGIPVLILFLALRRRRVAVLELTLTVAFLLGTFHAIRFVIYLFIAAAGLWASLPVRPTWSALARKVTGAVSIGLFLALVAVPSV